MAWRGDESATLLDVSSAWPEHGMHRLISLLGVKQKSEISHSLDGKWPSKNKGTRDASVGRSNYSRNYLGYSLPGVVTTVYSGKVLQCTVVTVAVQYCVILDSVTNILYRIDLRLRQVLVESKCYWAIFADHLVSGDFVGLSKCQYTE